MCAAVARECASNRLVQVDVGEDGRSGLVVFHYLDDPAKRRFTITREAFFLNGYYVADFASKAERSGIQDSGVPGGAV